MKQYLIILLSFFTLSVFAQQVKLTGKVTSASDKQPMMALPVLVKGTNNGTLTDLDGNFTLNNVPKTGTIVFCRIIAMNNPMVYKIPLSLLLYSSI
jgi:hypothetical protein